jgi:D-alanyl-D-alanine carboxypeptidase
MTVEEYAARVARCLASLGIPAAHAARHQLPLCPEAMQLHDVGPDIYGRERQLTPHAAARWMALRDAASGDGIILQLVSAFRSLDYQRQIFERKLSGGQSLEMILEVNVPPGYSEHHTGRAVDLTTPDCPPLSEEFETTAAFDWLTRHGDRFGFSMTYPRGNRFGVAYEPWHWTVRPEAVDTRTRS